MIYVDENLCSGCGVCVDTCRQGALTLRGNTASIDQDLCTSCGRCVDVCLTGAIIVLELEPETASPAVVSSSQPTPAQAGWSPSSPSPPAAKIARSGALDTIGKVLSGLFGIAGYALDHDLISLRRRPSTRGSGGTAFRQRPGGGSCGRQGSGRGGGRRAGGGAGTGGRRRAQKRDRSC